MSDSLTTYRICGLTDFGAFKFLPVLGQYAADAVERSLPIEMQNRWRFRIEYRNKHAFNGDGSRGGPERREFTQQEKANL